MARPHPLLRVLLSYENHQCQKVPWLAWEELLCPVLHLLGPSDLPGETLKDLFTSGAGGWDKGERSDITVPSWGCLSGLDVDDPNGTPAAGRGEAGRPRLLHE